MKLRIARKVQLQLAKCQVDMEFDFHRGRMPRTLTLLRSFRRIGFPRDLTVDELIGELPYIQEKWGTYAGSKKYW